jgi:hypothetical protein
MKIGRAFLALILILGLAGVAFVAQRAEPSGHGLTRAARGFLASLDEQQRAKASFAFDDSERTRWHFVPLQDQARKSTRKGLPLAQMTEQQRQKAFELLKAGTSPSGNQKATSIMGLELILRELEKGGRMVRDPEWYFFSVFGKPEESGRWGWRVDGHHLSLNFVVENGAVVASTPAFFGANPATIKNGPRQGFQALPEADSLALALYKSLDDEERKVAHQDNQFPEVAGQTAAPKVGEPVGLAAREMTDEQRALLMRLVRSYADRMPDDVAQNELAKIKEAGFEKIHFAFAGGTGAGQPHSYRVQGPTFVIEFLNVQADSGQNPANHIHSAWRNVAGDFAIPLAATK